MTPPAGAALARPVLPLAVALVAAGCAAVGPDYEPPAVNTPDEWTYAISSDLVSPRTGAQRWWRQFHDPTLDRLIAQARADNPNVNRARARIAEGWYQRSVLAAAFFPHSDFYGRDEYGMGTFDSEGVKFDAGSSHDQLAQIDAGWEIDLFGRIRRQVEAADAEWQARTEGWRDALVFISGEVALHYIALRTLEDRLEVADDAVATFRDIHQLTAGREEEGVAAEVDVSESKARLRTAEADLPQLRKEHAVVKNRLAALLGMHPGEVDRHLGGTGSIPRPPRSIATGQPAELLRSRPDVRRAERKVAAQTARIGVATANLYPQLSLSGAITYEYLRTGTTVDLLRRTLGLGPTLRWRIFHACADRYRIKEQEAKLEEVLHDYEGTVIAAVTEVENSLARLHFEKQRLAKLEGASAEHAKTAKLMREAYESDLVDLRRLLNAHQDLFLSRDEEAATRGRHAAHAVRLFKALGGGELPPPEPLETGKSLPDSR